MIGAPTKVVKRRGAASTHAHPVAPIERTRHPDDFKPGLCFAGKALNTKSVARAKSALDVFRVCLEHNLRQGNERHRHRRESIDPARTHLNQTLRGADALDKAVGLILGRLNELGIAPRRTDAIVGVELVIQAPPGWDRPEFWMRCLDWVEDRYQHVVHAIVHRDQSSVHAHVIALAVQNGQFNGNAMTSGQNMFKVQRSDFMAHMRHEFGIRPDRQAKTLEQLVLSTGRGPKTWAAAERRDRELLKLHAAGMGVVGHGGSPRPNGNPHAQVSESTPILRRLSRLFAAVADVANTRHPGAIQSVTRPCPPPPLESMSGRPSTCLPQHAVLDEALY